MGGQPDRPSAGLATSFEDAKLESSLRGAQRKTQRGGRGFTLAARRAEQHRKRAASFRGQLQAAQVRVAHGGQPGEHRAAGVRPDGLFGSPERIALVPGLHHQKAGEIDAGGSQRRCIGRVGRRDPGEALAPARQGGQGRAEKAHFTDAFVGRQDFGESPHGPAATGEFAIERIEAAGDAGK